MFPRRRSRQRGYPVGVLLTVLFIGALLPFFVLVIWGARQLIAEETTEIHFELSRQSAALAKALDRELRGFWQTAQMAALAQVLQRSDITAKQNYLRNAADHTGGHFILIDRSFQQIVNTAAPDDATLPEVADPEAAHHIFATGQPMVRDLRTGPVLGGPRFAVKVPVVVNAVTVYVLTFLPRSAALAEVVEQTFRPGGWLASVVDSQGRIVVHSHDPKRLGAASTWWPLDHLPEQVFEAPDEDGRISLVSHHPSRLSGWRAFVWLPKAKLDAKMNEIVVSTKIWVAVALLGSALAAFISGYTIQMALRRLSVAATQVGQRGAVSYKASFVAEANSVATRLNEAAERITAREKELRSNEERLRLITRELNHRSKNLLAVIQVMARQTARRATDVMGFLETFSERLAGIARSHDVITERGWGAIPVMDLINRHMGSFLKASGRIECRGSDVALQASAAQDVGMILHELATNAVKYGALSTPSGRVNIEWRKLAGLAGKHGLEVRWIETGGPAVTAPARKGFGFTLLEGVIANIGGSSDVDWRAEGLRCTIVLPHSCLSLQPSADRIQTRSPTSTVDR